MRSLVIVVAAVCTGGLSCCPTAPDADQLNACRDGVLDLLFTAEARQVIGDVPLRIGEVNDASGFAVGPDPVTQFVAGLYGNGFCRQVLISPDERAVGSGTVRINPITTFHEYIHQAHYSGLIDHALMRERFSRLLADPQYGGGAQAVRDVFAWANGNNELRELAYAFVPDAELIEMVAYVPQYWLLGAIDLPDYMLEVYVPVLDLEAMRSLREQHIANTDERYGPMEKDVAPPEGAHPFAGNTYYKNRKRHPVWTYVEECEYAASPDDPAAAVDGGSEDGE